jgi:FkbM family methyltransferase
MNDFFDNINKNETGKLIHVGAGTGIDLKECVTQRFAEILLLEPIPKVFKQLESKLEKLNKINVQCNITALNVALSSCTDATKEKTFYITLPNRYSSLHKADKLKTLFQNLKTEQELTVSTINFSDLINQASLDKDKKNALVLQINGAEFEVLAQAKTDELMLFSSIVIQHSNNNYFENAKTSTDLIALMKTKSFQLAIEADNDVVFSSLVFRKDESTLKLKALTEQSKTQTARIGELENQLKASNESKVSELTEARAEATAKASELTEARAKANTTAEQSKTQTARIGELENQLKASNEAKASVTNKAHASAEQSEIQKVELTEQNIQLTRLKESLSHIEQEKTDIIKDRDSQAHWHQENKKWAESLKVQIGKLESELAEKSRAIILGQKMTAKATLDSEHLRESYSQRVESERMLVELVKELREKLTLASRYYSQLQKEHPELLLSSEKIAGN